MYKCAPDKQYSDGSCYSLESLKKIALAYNTKLLSANYNDKYISKEKLIKLSNNRKELLSQLKTRLQDFCDNEMCWKGLDFVKSLKDLEIDKFTFRPEGPKSSHGWLNTLHINNILEQYMKIYNNYYHLGTVPIDFNKLPILGIKDLDYNELEKQGYNKFSMVINTDEHYKSGQHWIAVFIDTENNNTQLGGKIDRKVGKVYFFDSVGTIPEDRVIEFLASSAKYIMKKYKIKYLKDLDIKHNHIQHQQGNTECGIYSVNFILRLLKGESYNDIIKRQMTDTEVHKCRKVYFNNA